MVVLSHHPFPENIRSIIATVGVVIMVVFAIAAAVLTVKLILLELKIKQDEKAIKKSDKRIAELTKLAAAMKEFEDKGYPEWWISTVFQNQIAKAMRKEEIN